jgi:GNAT superfamily N-acetyltransferase
MKQFIDSTINPPNKDLPCKMERNLITQFRFFSGIKEATIKEDDTLTEFVSGYKTSWMNGVLRTNGNYPNLEDLISQTLSKYSKHCPMLWRIGKLTSQPQLVKEALIKNGLKFEGADVAMALDKSRFCKSTILPEFVVQSVNKLEKVEDWLIPFAEAYSLADDVIDHFRQFMFSRVEQSQVEGWFTGYVNELPVSSAYYLTDNEVTVIYAVGTLSNFRKHGYGRRIVEAAINHALEHSNLPITLYASEMGHPLYKNMGFVDLYRLENYLYSEI